MKAPLYRLAKLTFSEFFPYLAAEELKELKGWFHSLYFFPGRRNQINQSILHLEFSNKGRTFLGQGGFVYLHFCFSNGRRFKQIVVSFRINLVQRLEVFLAVICFFLS